MSYLAYMASAAAPGPGYGTHRYWRVYVASNAGAVDYTAIGELEFRATVGGANQTVYSGSSTPAIDGGAGATGFGNYPYLAFDGDTTTVGNDWARSATGGVWLGYDFTTPVTVAEVLLTGTTNGYSRSPATGTLDWSDDGVSWTTVASFDFKLWVRSANRTIPATTYGSGFHRAWRVFCLNNNGGTSFIELGEIEFRATAGGPDQTYPIASDSGETQGRALCSSEGVGNEAWRAFDNITANLSPWAGTSTANEWVGYVFPTPVEVKEVFITAPHQLTRAAKDMLIEYTDDGVTWTTAASFSKTWASTTDTVTVTVP